MSGVIDHASLSEDEAAYVEQYDELVDDGEVTENERKLLDFARAALELSEVRAKELEEAMDSGRLRIPSEEE